MSYGTWTWLNFLMTWAFFSRKWQFCAVFLINLLFLSSLFLIHDLIFQKYSIVLPSGLGTNFWRVQSSTPSSVRSAPNLSGDRSYWSQSKHCSNSRKSDDLNSFKFFKSDKRQNQQSQILITQFIGRKHGSTLFDCCGTTKFSVFRYGFQAAR